ncbi:MAG: alpha/beta fold hydrolase [Melioribacteraceae bacterium]|nr:alpha/beta fold hydrolase [Melioribacteraceae bacterium]MCF8356234.1 alpha/beta fold hydrolase [Melioribacteraceae bacterium]MCF8394995.1 alpha/beta fold hydrolase [Melioribacteraceae bacterium]MCF8419715.1 alpha/beta fold hydrolase [Melioribacteraceae bacterium]
MKFDPVIQDPPEIDPKYLPSMTAVTFESSGSKLIGAFLIANGKGPHPTVIMLHGFPGNETNFDISHAIRRFGFNVLIFHYRGSWGSKGKFSWLNCFDDVKSSVRFLESEWAINELRVDPERIILMGHSMGGFLSLIKAADFDKIKHIAAFAPFNLGYFGKLIMHNEYAFALTNENISYNCELLNASPDDLISEMIEHSETLNLFNYIEKLLNKNILLIGADNDFIAPAELHFNPFTEALENAGCKNLTKITFDSGHSFSNKRIELTYKIIDWLKANKI